MKINPFIFRNYDIRGIAGEDLNSEKVEAIGKAYGTFLYRRKIRQAVVGRDCRLSGEEFQNAFTKGLISTGIDIIDIGIVMTQMVYYSQYRFQTNGGAMITASHNPAKFNGFKLAVGYSKTTEVDDVQEIKKTMCHRTLKCAVCYRHLFLGCSEIKISYLPHPKGCGLISDIRKYAEDENYYNAEKNGTVTKADVWNDYLNDVLKRVRLKKKFKIVADFRHGTPGMYVPEIIKKAGCDIVSIQDKVDGSFPAGTPDPTDERFMGELGKIVLKEKADFGIGFDGDGDRIGVVDEKGRILWNDILVAIFAKEILERFPKSKIIYNTLCSQAVPKVIEQCGGKPVMWLTGHAFIKAKIAEEKAAFGGELSSHFFFNDNAYGHDDGSYAALRILEYLSDKNLSLSQLYESFPKYISSPEIKIGCPDERKKEIIKDLSKKFKADFSNAKITDEITIPNNDGVRADFDDGMIIFRYSQNGPYITVKFEATDQNTYDKRKKYVNDILHSYPEMIWQDELCVNLHSLD